MGEKTVSFQTNEGIQRCTTFRSTRVVKLFISLPKVVTAPRVDPIPSPPLPRADTRVQRERITKQDIDEFGATVEQLWDVRRTTNVLKPTQIVAECDLKDASGSLRKDVGGAMGTEYRASSQLV